MKWFIKTFKKELCWTPRFATLEHARMKIRAWIKAYNYRCPCQALIYRAPVKHTTCTQHHHANSQLEQHKMLSKFQGSNTFKQMRNSNFLRFIVVTIWLLNHGSLSIAQNKDLAQGILFYMSHGDTEATARATLYRQYRQAAPRSFFDVGRAVELAVENGLILQMVDLSQAFNGNISNDAQRQAVSQIASTLDQWASRCPKTSDLCNSVKKVISTTLSRYDNGEVRLNGVWSDKAEYLKAMSSAAKNEQEALKIRQTQFDNLKIKYPAKAAEYILSERGKFNQTVIKHLENFNHTKSSMILDDALRQRSKLIPPPKPSLEAGIYSSDFGTGPAVMWIAANSHLVAIKLGLIVETDIQSGAIANIAEMNQVAYFLNRINSQIYSEIPVCLAAYKVSSLLEAKKTKAATSVKSFSINSISDISVECAVHSEKPNSGNKISQTIIINIFSK